MRWGLIPSWSKDETIGDKLTNARADTISEKPSYRRPFEKQRCLIPADGFYEWQTTPTGKQPFRFTMKGRGFFCMAGLWEKWIRPPRAGELAWTKTIRHQSNHRDIHHHHHQTKPDGRRRSQSDAGDYSSEHFQWWLQPDRFEPQFLKTLLRPYLPNPWIASASPNS